MSILKPATNKMAYGKVGIYGTAGSGKTRTASEIAIGLHKAIGSTKPVVAFDTEPAFSFVQDRVWKTDSSASALACFSAAD